MMKLLLFPFSFALLLALPAAAQGEKPDASPTPPPGISSQLQGLLGGALTPVKPNAALSPTTFTSTGQLLFVDEMLGKLTLDVTQQQQFRQYAAQVVKLVETAYQENGFPKNDVGVALGGLLEVSYELDQGTFKIGATDKQEEEANKKKTKAVVRQLQNALGNAPAFKTLPERNKQMAYEASTFTIGHMVVSWQQAGEDAEKKKAVRQMARQQIETLFRFDPDGITRNASGEFVPKKGANPAPPAANPPGATPPGAGEESGQRAPVAPERQHATAATAPKRGAPPAAPTAGPAGWKTERLAGDVLRLTPADLPEGETLSVTVFPLRSLSGKPIETWLAAAIQNDPLPPGKLQAAPTVKAASGNVATGTAAYAVSGGAPVVAVYNVVSVDKEMARLFRILTPADGKTLTRYKAEISKLTGAVIQADKKTAVAAGRGLDLEKLPTTPKGMSPGGEIQPGIYAGTQLYGEEVSARYRLYLYPNGQYRLFDQKGEQLNSSVRLGYAYDPRSGRLDLESGIQYRMLNDRNDPDDDMCLYGHDQDGKPYVYARSDRGFNYATTVLRYTGPLDKPSPEDEEAKKAWAEAEAKRYKLVVPAGQGLKPAQVAGVLLHQEVKQFYNGSGLSVSSTYDLYLLLNDGTIYNGLPVVPDEMDVPRSRRNEPEKWGRWKRNGTEIVAAWPDAPTQFRPLKGDLMKPGSKGLKLVGRYGSGETSGSLLGSSYRLWGVTFTPDGRFLKDNRGGYGNSTLAQNSGAPAIYTTHDDEGAVTSASGENFFVGSTTKKKQKGDRSGTYSVEGYVLTLKYDDGRVIRQPFFLGSGNENAVWFEGALLTFDKDEKGGGAKR